MLLRHLHFRLAQSPHMKTRSDEPPHCHSCTCSRGSRRTLSASRLGHVSRQMVQRRPSSACWSCATGETSNGSLTTSNYLISSWRPTRNASSPVSPVAEPKVAIREMKQVSDQTLSAILQALVAIQRQLQPVNETIEKLYGSVHSDLDYPSTVVGELVGIKRAIEGRATA